MKNKLVFFEEEPQNQFKQQNPQIKAHASCQKFLIHFSSDQQSTPTPQQTHHQNISEIKQAEKQSTHIIRKCNSLMRKLPKKPFFRDQDSSEIVDEPKSSSFIHKQKLKKITAVGDLSEQYQQVIQLSKTTPISRKNKNHRLNLENNDIEVQGKQIQKQQKQSQIKFAQKAKSKSLLFQFDQDSDKEQQIKVRKTANTEQLFNTFESKQFLKEKQTEINKKNEDSDASSQPQLQSQYCIINPSESIKKHSYELSHYFSTFTAFDQKKTFTLRAIPKNAVLQFEVHQYQGFFKNTLQLWLNLGHSMIRMLKAKLSSSMNMKNSIYDITLENKGRQVKIAKIKSDFQRRNFQILDGQDSKQSILYGHFFYAKSLIFKSNELYVPIIQQQTNEYKTFYKNSISNYLGDLYKIPPNNKTICKLQATTLDKKIITQFNKKHQFQSSSRNYFLKDYATKSIRLAIGKKGNNRFKIVAGEGISPLIVFALGAVIMQIK